MTPILSAGAPATLLVIALRFGSDAVERLSDAVARLFIVRSATKPGGQSDHRETCVEMLRTLSDKDQVRRSRVVPAHRSVIPQHQINDS